MKKVNSRKGTCPVCGTVYKHASMASKCQRTAACKFYNAPGGIRKRAFEIQIGVGELIGYYCEPMTRSTYPQVQALAKTTLSHLDEMVGNILRLAISDKIFSEKDHAITDLILELWPLGVQFDVVHMIAITSNLLEDLKSELKVWFAVRRGEHEVWKKIERDIDDLYMLFDPDAEEKYPSAERVGPFYEKLRHYIFGTEAAAPKLKGYQVGRFWVAAFNKSQAREVIWKQFGLVKQSARGLHPNMKFDDGATLASILEEMTEPAVFGKEE